MKTATKTEEHGGRTRAKIKRVEMLVFGDPSNKARIDSKEHLRQGWTALTATVRGEPCTRGCSFERGVFEGRHDSMIFLPIHNDTVSTRVQERKYSWRMCFGEFENIQSQSPETISDKRQ